MHAAIATMGGAMPSTCIQYPLHANPTNKLFTFINFTLPLFTFNNNL